MTTHDRRRSAFSLANTLLLTVAVTALGVGAALAWQASTTLRKSLTAAFTSKGEAIALALAAASEAGEGSQLEMVQSEVDAHKVIYGVSYIFLVDANGQPRVHTFTPRFPEGLLSVNAIAIGEVLPDGTRVKVAGGVTFAAQGGEAHAIDVAAPIAAGALGAVHVGMDIDLVAAQVRDLRNNMFAWGGGVAAIAVLLSLVIATITIVRPIRDLTAFTVQIAAGALKPKATLRGPTEVRALGTAMNRMVIELAESRRELATKARLQKEFEIASRIQTSMLPHKLDVRGLEIAARMLPASEVGGDYYDLLPIDDGCWVGIGDVTGHGLTAGLVMMMVQTTVSSMVLAQPDSDPRQLVAGINEVLYGNIRERLRQDDHVTFSLLRYHRDGRLVFAGAHEEFLISRADRVERVLTPGTWIGVTRDIRSFTMDSTCTLANGDALVLYTDGVTEARNASGEEFGLERVSDVIERKRGQSAQVMCDAVIDAVQAWTPEQRDDVTVFVMRRQDSAGPIESAPLTA